MAFFGVDFPSCLVFGMVVSASNSLTLEQVPKFRGTMMSINSAAVSAGGALGAAVGGLELVLFNYGILESTLGAMGFAAAIVFYFLTMDPTGMY